MAERLPLVYIAAPYTHPDPVQNTHEVIKVADALWESRVCVPLVPHLSLLWHLVSPKPVDDWYAYDLHLLARCDALVRLAGPSTGADDEVLAAELRQIPVFYDADEVLAWAR